MGRGHRHLASASDPGSRRDIGIDQVSAGFLRSTSFRAKVAVERIDGAPILGEISTPALGARKEYARRLKPLSEGCSPFPQHANSLANIRSPVKQEFTRHTPTKRQSHSPRPADHFLFTVLCHVPRH